MHRAGPAAGPGAQARVEVGFRRPECRNRAEQNPRHDRQCRDERERWCVERERDEEGRRLIRKSKAQEADTPPRDRDAEHAAEKGDEHALGDQLQR